MGNYSIRQAVILAGGQGTRLRPLTFTTPKPMVLIDGKPFLEYLIRLLKKNKIQKILILTGYLHEQIENYFGDGKKFGLSILYSKTSIKDDTGTRIKKAKRMLDDQFLLLYGDNYWPLRLKQLEKFYRKMKTDALVTVYSNIDNYTKNNTYVNLDGFVEIYDKTRQNKHVNGVDIGFFILRKEIVNLLPKYNCSFEREVLPKLIKDKQLAGYVTYHKYYGLSNLDRISTIEDFFKPKKVVFLDRDGVINKKPAKAQYIINPEEFIFLPRVKKALKLLKSKGYKIFIVTNQPGIARKMLTESQLKKIHDLLIKSLRECNVEIEDILICKHGWDENCFCRKPNPGMFFQAAQKYNIDLYKSCCIGDDERDIISGKKAGCKTFLVNKKNDLYSIVSKYL